MAARAPFMARKHRDTYLFIEKYYVMIRWSACETFWRGSERGSRG